MDTYLLYILASNNWRLIRLSLLDKKYHRDYHRLIIAQYYKCIGGGESGSYFTYWGYEVGPQFILHRDKKPAIEWRNYTNPPIYSAWILFNREFEFCQMWFHHGKLHRLDGPAMYGTVGHCQKYMWAVDGQLHRKRGPAEIITSPNYSPSKYLGRFVSHEKWFWRGELHRKETGRNCGPAYWDIYSDDLIEIYYQFGSRHRISGPAQIRYRINLDNGKTEVVKKYWWRHGSIIWNPESSESDRTDK